MRYGSLFTGVKGLDLAVESFFGAECAWHSEVDPDALAVLAMRAPGVPNLGDVTKIDWDAVKRDGGGATGSLADVDLIVGGFP